MVSEIKYEVVSQQTKQKKHLIDLIVIASPPVLHTEAQEMMYIPVRRIRFREFVDRWTQCPITQPPLGP